MFVEGLFADGDAREGLEYLWERMEGKEGS
jgi:hypothetical protein